jgi:polygalacturonase
MSTSAKWIPAIVLLALLSVSRAYSVLRTFVANDYGAKGDSPTLDTSSIQWAIDAASAVGGTVSLRPGTYLSGSLFLKSGVTFNIPAGAAIIDSESLKDYPMLPTRIAGIEMTWPAALINVRGSTLNAECVVSGLKSLPGDPLNRFFSAKGQHIAPYHAE